MIQQAPDFAGTSDAANINMAQLSRLVQSRNATVLTALLSYHIVPGVALRAAELRNGQSLPSAVRGEQLRVATDAAGHVRIIGAGSQAVVTQPDIMACNGNIVHIVDTVLVPIRSGAPSPYAGASYGSAVGAAAPSYGASQAGAGQAGAAVQPQVAAGGGA